MAKVTIYDIAAKTGVSSSTVARALRGDLKEAQARSVGTAEKIRRVAAELGYQPNLRARSFARASTKGIGLMYFDPAWVFHGVNYRVIQSLEAVVRPRGYHLTFVPIGAHDEWEEIVLGGQVDGLATLQPVPVDIRAKLVAANTSCVSFNGEVGAEVLHVGVDDFGGAYAATKLLARLGHRRIELLVDESINDHYSVVDRDRGFRAALEETGGVSGPFHRINEEEILAMLSDVDRRPTGLVCYTEMEAAMAAHAAWVLGIRVPEELSLIGFNDHPLCRQMTPPLTTVAFDAERMGELGGRMLLRLLEGTGAPPASVTLKQRLTIRGSTGPAPKHKPASR